MPILQQVATVSYFPYPALPAPSIAGLLPARVDPPPPTPSPDSERGQGVRSFTYRNATLSNLAADKLAQFIDAATTLLDVAVAHAHGEMNDNALRAAQVLFHRQLTGHSPDRTVTPTAYRAERDADLLEWLVGVRKRLAPTPNPSPVKREGSEVTL